MGVVAASNIEVGSPLVGASAVAVSNGEYGEVAYTKTSASACTYKPTAMPTASVGTSSDGGSNSKGGSVPVSSAAAFDYLSLYIGGLVLFAVFSVVYVFYSNRNKAVLKRSNDEHDMRTRSGLLSESSHSDGSSVVEAHSVTGEPVEGHMVYNDATGNFEYDTQFYDYNNEAEPDMYEEDQQAPTAAFDWTGMDADLPVTEATATSSDFFTRPPLAPRSTNAEPAMSVGSESDSSARVPHNTPVKKSSFGKMTNPLKGLSKPGNKAGGKALNLGSLKDKTKDAPRRPARDVAAANTSWSEVYNDGMWGDDNQES